MKWTEIRQEWLARPGFLEALEREYPYRDVSLAVGGLRADLDMTQTEFGQLIGVPQSTVARLESGQQNPSVGMLKRIAKATSTELSVEFRKPGRRRRADEKASVAGPGVMRAGMPLAAAPADD